MSPHEAINEQAEQEKIETYIAHHTLRGAVDRLHEALEEFVDAVKDSFPKVF